MHLALLLAFFFAVGACARATPDSALAASGPEASRAIEQRTFQLINAYREKDGLPALKWHDGIAKLARTHSRDMAAGDVDFGHGGFSDRVDGMKALVAGFRGAGENVFFTDNPNAVAEKAVEGWLHSPHHLKNIRGDYNFSGVGVCQASDGKIYFTQLFLKAAEPGNE